MAKFEIEWDYLIIFALLLVLWLSIGVPIINILAGKIGPKITYLIVLLFMGSLAYLFGVSIKKPWITVILSIVSIITFDLWNVPIMIPSGLFIKYWWLLFLGIISLITPILLLKTKFFGDIKYKVWLSLLFIVLGAILLFLGISYQEPNEISLTLQQKISGEWFFYSSYRLFLPHLPAWFFGYLGTSLFGALILALYLSRDELKEKLMGDGMVRG